MPLFLAPAVPYVLTAIAAGIGGAYVGSSISAVVKPVIIGGAVYYIYKKVK